MNSIWSQYPIEEREQYIHFLKAYGSLTNLFLQKNSNIPYLDSKFQETIYGRVFKSQNTDIGNTPHDIVSDLNEHRIGIGLKTWMNSAKSYQKVMQLKSHKAEIDSVKNDIHEQAYVISSIKNQRLEQDYLRLGLNKDGNIYHYVTRDKGQFTIFETAYPEVDLHNITNVRRNSSSLQWSDRAKNYRFTYADSQVLMEFDPAQADTTEITKFSVDVIDNPFDFLIKSYDNYISELRPTIIEQYEPRNDVAYLPLYSYSTGEVETKSGLNAWNAAPKNKGSNAPRPLSEIYIPVPMEFHRLRPDFFCPNIFTNIRLHKPIEFTIILPNGTAMPGRLTGDNLKNFQSGSIHLHKPDGTRWGQSDLGEWLLVKVLGLHQRQLVTRAWLEQRGVDSIKLWHHVGDYKRIYLDFAKTGSFDNFMKNIQNSVR